MAEIPEDAERALLRAYGARLEPDGQSVYPVFSGQAPARQARPFIVIGFGAGGRAWKTRTKDAAITIDAVCVADDLLTALAGAAYISERLENSGSQDYGANAGALVGGNWWEITTVTEGGKIAFDEQISGGSDVIYHRGAQYDNNMERIA